MYKRQFEEFGGVPRMWVPDNAATATDRAAAPRVTLVNREYERFAEHYGAAVLPARVRRPRDKSVAESCVDLVERWIIGPSGEMTFYTCLLYTSTRRLRCLRFPTRRRA